jgi:hypothetical protein
MSSRSTSLCVVTCAMAALQLSCGASSGDKGSSADASTSAQPDGSTDATSLSEGGTFPMSDASASDAGSPCTVYQQLCGGACITVVVDPDNCGGCGVKCTGGQVCSGGSCAAGCLPGLTACAGSCVDLLTDDDHCGTCGVVCPAGQGCGNGTCVATVPLADAGAGGCAGDAGAPVTVQADAGALCVGQVAQTTFTWALCSCTDITFSASVLTDGYNSAKGGYKDGGLGGGVGLDGKFAASVPTIDIGGTLWEASDGGMSQFAQTIVRQELHVGGPLYGAAMTVLGDTHVTGDVSSGPGNPSDPSTPHLHIDGGLYQSPGSTIAGNVTYQGAVQPELHPVTPPCDCAHPIPVAEIAHAGQTANDNASIGLDPGLLSSLSTPPRLDLPCGAFYFDSIHATGPLTIVAHGHTVIFVGADIFTTSPLEITVDPTGTLDVFIAGTISSETHLSFGNPNYPALERLYVGTPLGIPFTTDVVIAANLYAAASSLVSWSSATDIYGSVIAGDFISSQPTRIHYDQGILSGGGSSCPDAGVPGCGSCKDCGNQACIDGQCGSCTSSAQCCPPLECFNGTCQVVAQ